MYEAFSQLDTVVIAVAQEDTDLKSHGRILRKFQSPPPFEIAADFERLKTKRYDRTTAYLIDKAGIVREVFPMLIHHRASWQAILHEVEKLN